MTRGASTLPQQLRHSSAGSVPIPSPNPAACGWARWKIENETFNVLKNNGYNPEHNFGHGKQNHACHLW